VEFYTPFLSELHERDTVSNIAILAHGHLNHASLPSPDARALDQSLLAQVQNAIEAFDALEAEFREHTRIIVIGHSVGAFIATQVCADYHLVLRVFSVHLK